MESDDQATAVTWATMRYFTASSVHLLSARVYTAAAVQVAFCEGHAGFLGKLKTSFRFCPQELTISFPFANQTPATVLLLLMDDRFLLNQTGLRCYES